MQLQDRFYKSTEVAEILGVSLRTLYRYMESAKINSVHLPSGRHRFTKQQIEEFLYSNAFEPDIEREEQRPIRQQPQQNYSNFQRPVKPLEVNSNPYVNSVPKVSPIKNEPTIPTDEELDRQLDELLKSLNTDDTTDTNIASNASSNIEFAPKQNYAPSAPVSTPQYANPIPTPTPTPVVNNDNYMDTDDDELDKLLKSLEEDDEDEKPQSNNTYNFDNAPKSYTSLSDDSFDGFRIKPQEEYLDENKVMYFYCPSNDLRTIAKIIKKAGDENGLKYAFTLNAGASLFFPLDPFSIIHFYVHKNDLDVWKKELQLKDSNADDANIGILLTKGNAFDNMSEVSGLKVVNKNILIDNLRHQNLSQLARQVEDQL